ncbi:MAG: heat-inducible transcriptional repressor HrcA [Firmicutes bacterium]|nr:heat-inducible transcriptional repressor HrcA [Bacillota bacterium]
MVISHRKERILQAVVSSYIDNCEPVSSAHIHQKYFPEVSSATIRNELATLEEMGYLTHPHVSAGRIPTAAGYRLYVDKLMPKHKLSRQELKTIKHYINDKVRDLENMVRNTAKVISEITNLTAVGYVQNQKTDMVKNVKIVKISENAALFVIVTDRTVLKDAIANLPDNVSEQFLQEASVHITSIFAGHTIDEISNPVRFAKLIRKEYERIFDAVVRIIKNYGGDGVGTLSVEGSAKILSQPEYSNIGKARAMLELLEAKEQLVPMLNGAGLNFSVKIAGADEMKEGLPECAIVTASFSGGGGNATAGVIGPIRMDYGKVLTVLDYIGREIASLPQGKDIMNEENIEENIKEVDNEEE